MRQRLRELSGERRRFGYRRVHIPLQREGRILNWKKLYRIYREKGLTVRKRGGRKRALMTCSTNAVPVDINVRTPLSTATDQPLGYSGNKKAR